MRMLILNLVVGFLTLSISAQALIQVTKNGAGRHDRYPAISEDGQVLAWSGTDPATGGDQIWVADRNTLMPRRITGGTTGLDSPYPLALSGDGSWIAFIKAGNLYRIHSKGGRQKKVTNYTGTKGIYSWCGVTLTRNGDLACFTTYDSSTHIYNIEVANTRTSSVVNITRLAPNDYCTGCISGDGTTVAFTANRGKVRDQVWLASVSGPQIRMLTDFASGKTLFPRLDYRAGICAFESRQSGDYEVYTIRTDGSNLVNVSQNPGYDDRRVKISSDGDRVTWKSNRGMADMYMAYPDGTGHRKLTSFGGMMPSHTDSSHALNGDGTVAVFASHADIKGGNPEKDYEIHLWTDTLSRIGKASPGFAVTYPMEDTTRPGTIYQMRCSLGRNPGIPIPGVGTVPLTPDALFLFSGSGARSYAEKILINRLHGQMGVDFPSINLPDNLNPALHQGHVQTIGRQGKGKACGQGGTQVHARRRMTDECQ